MFNDEPSCLSEEDKRNWGVVGDSTEDYKQNLNQKDDLKRFSRRKSLFQSKPIIDFEKLSNGDQIVDSTSSTASAITNWKLLKLTQLKLNKNSEKTSSQTTSPVDNEENQLDLNDPSRIEIPLLNFNKTNDSKQDLEIKEDIETTKIGEDVKEEDIKLTIENKEFLKSSRDQIDDEEQEITQKLIEEIKNSILKELPNDLEKLKKIKSMIEEKNQNLF